MMDMGPYYMTALVSMLGPIKQISGFCSKNRPVHMITSMPLRGTKIDVEVPTNYMGIIEFASGICVNMIMSFEIWNSQMPTIEIHGTTGSMYCSDPDNFSGPVYLTRSNAVIDQMADMDTSDLGVKGDPFDKTGLVRKMPLLFNDPMKKTRGLGRRRPGACRPRWSQAEDIPRPDPSRDGSALCV